MNTAEQTTMEQPTTYKCRAECRADITYVREELWERDLLNTITDESIVQCRCPNTDFFFPDCEWTFNSSLDLSTLRKTIGNIGNDTHIIEYTLQHIENYTGVKQLY